MGPDGKALLVLAKDGNQQFWYRLDIASGVFTQLALHGSGPGAWAHGTIRTLSADGKTLYQGAYIDQSSSELDRIIALDLTTGTSRNVFKLPVAREALEDLGLEVVVGLDAFDLAPGGVRLAYSTLRPEGAGNLLWRLDVASILKNAR